MITKTGDLLRAFEDGQEALFHCCNCQSNMGSGIALHLRQKWPAVLMADTNAPIFKDQRLGKFSVATLPEGLVYNAYGQFHWRFPERPLNYEGIFTAMEGIRDDMKKRGLTKLACAYLTGCDRAKGDWGVVTAMINSIFTPAGIEVTAYKLA